MARDMTVGNERRHILTFALPIMGGLVLQQLYNTVDSVVVGRFLGEAALGAVGACSALTMFVVSFAMGLCNGGGVVFAQLFGAKRLPDLRRALSTAFILLVGLSLVVTGLGIALARGLLSGLLQVPQEILEDAMAYFRIYCIGLAFQFVYNVCAAALRSVGDSQSTLWFLLISSILNIVLDLLFVLRFHMGVAGTAWATIIAQGVSAAVSVVYLWRRYDFYRFGKGEFRFDGEKCRTILKLGIPGMLQMCIVSFGNVLMQRVINALGTTAIAAATAAGRIENYMFIPCQGLNNGIGTFTGQNVGAGKMDRVVTGRRKAQSVLLPVAVAMAVGLFLFAKPLVAIFGVSGEALGLGVVHLRVVAPFFIVFAMYMANAGVLTGAGDVMAATGITLGVLALRVVLTYLFHLGFHMGFASVYVPTPIGWAFGFVGSLIRFRGGKWKKKALVKGE